MVPFVHGAPGMRASSLFVLRCRCAAIALLAAGCIAPPAPPQDDDDPFTHRTYTAWQPLPSKDGARLALALEPRRVDADSQGVMVNGWNGQVAGDGVVVMASDGSRAPVATVPRGFLDADRNDDVLFVSAKAASTWTPVAPNDMPPSAPYASVTWLDRASFAVLGTRAFDPPLEMPTTVGGTLVLDTPRPGASDVERDVRVTLHDVAQGRAEPLLAERGFGVSICARGNAVSVAWQRGTDATSIVDVVVDASGKANVARLDLDDFLADALRCRGGGAHIAVVGGRPSNHEGRALVLHRTDDALSLAFENSVALPAALSRDGATLLATGPDGGAMLVTSTGAHALDGVHAAEGSEILVSEDRALVDGSDASFVVRLDGTEPATSKVALGGPEHAAFAVGGGAFLIFETADDEVHYAQALTRAIVVGDDGAAEVALPGYLDPTVAFADARHAWIVGGHANDDGVDLVSLDLAGKSVERTVPFPLCDRAAMQNEGRCFP